MTLRQLSIIVLSFNLWTLINRDNMAKEKGKENEADGLGEQPKRGRAAYMEYMSGMNPDFNGEDEDSVYDDMLSYRKGNDESRKKISDMLSENPQLAQVLSDIANKKRGAGAAFARYFGKDLLNAEEGTPEWDEIQQAEKERNEELMALRKRGSDYDANIEASKPVLDEFGKENGINVDDFLDEAYSKIIEPIFLGKYDKDLLQRLRNALAYEGDMETSFNAGKAAGRNERIEDMRKANVGDGMPRMGSSAGMQKPIEKANKPIRRSVWD